MRSVSNRRVVEKQVETGRQVDQLEERSSRKAELQDQLDSESVTISKQQAKWETNKTETKATKNTEFPIKEALPVEKPTPAPNVQPPPTNRKNRAAIAPALFDDDLFSFH
jgi:hypothetical protein